MYPWHIEDSDLVEAGDPELVRDLASERQIGLHIVTSCPCRLSLGVLALRCERKGATVIPLTLSIADTPIAMPVRKSAMDVTLLSGPRRVDDEGDC